MDHLITLNPFDCFPLNSSYVYYKLLLYLLNSKMRFFLSLNMGEGEGGG